MTEKPEIKVGQRWNTFGGSIVRILATDADGDRPVVGQFGQQGGGVRMWTFDGIYPDNDDWCLVSLAPSTVKREVALYQDPMRNTTVAMTDVDTPAPWRCISEPLTIEFTLLPGESDHA